MDSASDETTTQGDTDVWATAANEQAAHATAAAEPQAAAQAPAQAGANADPQARAAPFDGLYDADEEKVRETIGPRTDSPIVGPPVPPPNPGLCDVPEGRTQKERLDRINRCADIEDQQNKEEAESSANRAENARRTDAAQKEWDARWAAMKTVERHEEAHNQAR